MKLTVKVQVRVEVDGCKDELTTNRQKGWKIRLLGDAMLKHVHQNPNI